MLNQLLRKKLEPHVEDWVEEGRKSGEELPDPEGVTELWEWAGMAANEQARKHEWGGEFTIEEREWGVENVVTGLKRGFEEGESSDDDEEEEDGEGKEKEDEKMRPMAMEDVLRVLAKGQELKK